MRSIGRVFGKPSSSIYFQLAPYGGIRPAPRRRSRLALTLSEREADARRVAREARAARDMGDWKRFHKKLWAERKKVWRVSCIM